MSKFHQIWDRPDEDTMKLAGRKSESPVSAAKTPRERAYIAALADFYQPGGQDFGPHHCYSAAMGTLYRSIPTTSMPAPSTPSRCSPPDRPNDTSLDAERKAMAVLTPLFAKYPDNPGLVHYIIHACDNPAMAQRPRRRRPLRQDRSSGPHAVHMPGHIFARLGMWPQDIDSQLASIKASEAAEAHHESGIMDEPHSYDFLMYAYLQSGQDARPGRSSRRCFGTRTDQGHAGHGHNMACMVPYYRRNSGLLRAGDARLASRLGAEACRRGAARPRDPDVVGTRHRRWTSSPRRAGKGRSRALRRLDGRAQKGPPRLLC